MIPVALRGSASFDPADVDGETLAFGRAGAPPLLVWPSQDLDGDGFPDRTALFRVSETASPSATPRCA